MIAACALLAAACSDEPPAAPPDLSGVVTARLISPNGAEGAAVFEVNAEAVESVLVDSVQAFTVTLDDRLWIALVRADAGEIRADLSVRDTTAALDPELIEVAGPSNELRRSLNGYSLELVP